MSLLALLAGLGSPDLSSAVDDPNPNAFATDDRPGTAIGDSGPTPVVVFPDGPVDWESLREQIQRPDLVILHEAEYEALRQRAGGMRGAGVPPDQVVEAVAIRGEVRSDQARLEVHLRANRSRTGTGWLPVRLEGLMPVRVREGDRTVPLRASGTGGWEVELAGPGRHELVVEVPVPLRNEAEGTRLDVAIPTAASTELDLRVPDPVATAEASAREPLGVEPAADGGSQIRGHLPPREQLTVSWKLAGEPGVVGPPVLSAQGEIALDLDRGTMISRSTWSVRCDRGQARELQLRVTDSSEELLSIELDGQHVPLAGLRDPASGLVTVPLSEPLVPGSASPVQLTMSTRRLLPAGATTRIAFSGYPILQAMAQTGVVAIVQGGDLWVSGNSGRGLRQLDPVSELPESLRVRPRTVLAYQFIEQPFELELRVDPSPPLSRVSARTTLLVEPTELWNLTELTYQVTRGRVLELRVGVPAGLELMEVGPRELVTSYRVLDQPRGAGLPTERYVHIRLGTQVEREARFRLQLQGRQRIDAGQPFQAFFFQPQEAGSQGGTVGVLTARSVSIDSGEISTSGAEGSSFTPIASEDPSAWIWPDAPGRGLPAFWVRYEGLVDSLPLRAMVRPRELHHRTQVLATVDRSRVALQQTTTCAVRHGSLFQIELIVPAALETQPGQWGVEGSDVVGRTLLGKDAAGAARYRLALGREVIDTIALKFWAALPIEPALGDDRPRSLEFPCLEILEGEAEPLIVDVRAEPGIHLQPVGEGWLSGKERPSTNPGPRQTTAQYSWIGPEAGEIAPTVQATAPALAKLPDLVVSRLWLRTVMDTTGGVQAEAWYRVETSRGAMGLALPPGARPLQVRVGNDPAEIEQMTDGKGFRIRLPADGTGPVLVGLTYTLPADKARAEHIPPRLLEGGVVQSTFWELRVPWTLAVVGVPGGWTDENTWYWAGYVWKRRPGLDVKRLSTWIAGNSTRGRIAAPEGEDERLGYHGYLFGTPGPPPSLEATVHSRAVLVAACSGSVLAVGVLLLLLRPTGRWLWLVLLGTILAIGVLVEPSVVLLGLQASLVGFVLVAVAFGTERLIERRHGLGPMPVEAPGVSSRVGSTPRAIDTTANVPHAEVGSDESTVIRRRPASPTTLDYIPSLEQQAIRENPSGSS